MHFSEILKRTQQEHPQIHRQFNPASNRRNLRDPSANKILQTGRPSSTDQRPPDSESQRSSARKRDHKNVLRYLRGPGRITPARIHTQRPQDREHSHRQQRQ